MESCSSPTGAPRSVLKRNTLAPRITLWSGKLNALAVPKDPGNQKNQNAFVSFVQISCTVRWIYISMISYHYLFYFIDGRCPELPLFERGSVTVSGLNANDTATYSCQLGHKLVGAKVITCRLGGKWSASPPVCQFVDCGPAPEPEHGSVWLINGTTTFSSQASYTCEADYRLQGRTTRLCQEDGNWSSSLPTCKREQQFPFRRVRSTSFNNKHFPLFSSYRMWRTRYSSW